MRVTDTLSDLLGYSKTYKSFWQGFISKLESGNYTNERANAAGAMFNQRIENDQVSQLSAKPSVCLIPAILYSLEKGENGKYRPFLGYNNVEAAASLLDTTVLNLVSNRHETGIRILELVEEVLGAHELLTTSIRRFKNFEAIKQHAKKCDLATKLQTGKINLRKEYANELVKDRVRDVAVRAHDRSRPQPVRCCKD